MGPRNGIKEVTRGPIGPIPDKKPTGGGDPWKKPIKGFKKPRPI